MKNCEIETIIKQQSKLTFNGIHKSYATYNSYAFKQNEVLLDKQIHVDLVLLELSKLHMYDSYYDKLEPYFGEEKISVIILIRT